MAIKVLKGGLQTTIQDLGRHGFREFGIAANGALDPYSHQIANWLVGNPVHNATLEITQIGPTLEFEEAVTVGVSGADFELFINDQRQPMNQTLQLKAGDILQFGKLLSGARAYLAIAGKLELKPLMQSQSTNLLAGFGGLHGRALQDGDTIDIKPKAFNEIRRTPETLLQEHHHNLKQHHLIIRITQGQEFSSLVSSSQESLLQSNFKVSSLSNRMALKLEGQKLNTTEEISMTTVPIVPGTIQLPNNGQPIVTLADGQTTGGYPRIGQVISADLGLLAQLKANDSVSFYPVTLEQAKGCLEQKNNFIKSALSTE